MGHDLIGSGNFQEMDEPFQSLASENNFHSKYAVI